jgi:hypothetical protein
VLAAPKKLQMSSGNGMTLLKRRAWQVSNFLNSKFLS